MQPFEFGKLVARGIAQKTAEEYVPKSPAVQAAMNRYKAKNPGAKFEVAKPRDSNPGNPWSGLPPTTASGPAAPAPAPAPAPATPAGGGGLAPGAGPGAVPPNYNPWGSWGSPTVPPVRDPNALPPVKARIPNRNGEVITYR